VTEPPDDPSPQRPVSGRPGGAEVPARETDGRARHHHLGNPHDGEATLEELVAERPSEALTPMRHPLALAGTSVAGFAMGVAEVVPGFSGGTVALVAGIYERLVATIRQGARSASLLLRGRPHDALRAFTAIEWPFVGVLLVGMLLAVFTLAGRLERLIEERPVELSAVFLGLVLGAAVVASRQLRAPTPWHVLVGVVAAAVTFVALGVSPGTIDDPALLLIFVGGALAVSAWILPGVSGSFLLLVLGLYPAVVGAVADRDLLVVAVFVLGCGVGIAAFSTLLNWLLARAHDVVLAALLGVMVGSVRILWPYPSDEGLGNPALGAPEGDTVFLALALALAAFALVWMFGLAASAVERRRAGRPAETDEGTDGDRPAGS
jgi:putative membrane protein